jgi:hypothetical protein
VNDAVADGGFGEACRIDGRVDGWHDEVALGLLKRLCVGETNRPDAGGMVSAPRRRSEDRIIGVIQRETPQMKTTPISPKRP